MSTPAPKCTKCDKYASHGSRCGQVECPCRKQVTAQVNAGRERAGVEPSTTFAKPTVPTHREYD